MATPQPQSQQPQQPIYAADLNFLFDRQFVRITSHFDDRFRGNDARMDAFLNEMRVGFAEAYRRDADLSKRIDTLEATVKTIIDVQREMVNSMQTMQQTILQEVRDGFAALNERINELTARVINLEGGMPPSAKGDSNT